MAFEGAFEKLFNIIVNEQGLEGGVVVQDALTCIDGLLRFNQSNQVRTAVMFCVCARSDELARTGKLLPRRAISEDHPSPRCSCRSWASLLRCHSIRLLHSSSPFNCGMSRRNVRTCRSSSASSVCSRHTGVRSHDVIPASLALTSRDAASRRSLDSVHAVPD